MHLILIFCFSCCSQLQAVKFCTHLIKPQILLLVGGWKYCTNMDFPVILKSVHVSTLACSLKTLQRDHGRKSDLCEFASTCRKRPVFCSASHVLLLPDKFMRNPGVASRCTKRWLWHCRMCTYTMLLLTALSMLRCGLLASSASGTLPCSRLCSNVWADCRLQSEATFHERWEAEGKTVADDDRDHLKPGGWRYPLQGDSGSNEAAPDKRHSLVLSADLWQQFALTCKHLFYFERSATGQILTRSLIVLRKSTSNPAGSG